MFTMNNADLLLHESVTSIIFMHQVSISTIQWPSQVSAMEPWVEDLRDLMPKAITLPPHDAGVEGIHLIF